LLLADIAVGLFIGCLRNTALSGRLFIVMRKTRQLR